MAMYHSWDAQNAWLRQIHTHNYLFRQHARRCRGHRRRRLDVGRVALGPVRCLCRHSEAVEPGTVWTWNAIGKQSGAWHLDAGANESRRGFLLNHLIREELPDRPDGATPPTPTPSPARPPGTTCACITPAEPDELASNRSSASAMPGAGMAGANRSGAAGWRA